MRLLSKEEQELCNKILNGSGHNNFLGNIIDDKLIGVCILITRLPPSVVLEFTIRNQNPTPDETQTILEQINQLSFFILTTVNLISLLEKEGYILLIRRATQVSATSKIGGCIGNLPSITNHFSDQNVTDLLIKFFDKEIIATAEFERFCKRGYIARDEQRFRTQFRVSMLALGVTTIALLANVFFNLLPRFTDGSKVNQHQIDTLANGLSTVGNKIDSLNKTVIRYSNFLTHTRKFAKKKVNLKESEPGNK